MATKLVAWQAIENGLGYGEWLHGEAVAAGTVSRAPCCAALRCAALHHPAPLLTELRHTLLLGLRYELCWVAELPVAIR